MTNNPNQAQNLTKKKMLIKMLRLKYLTFLNCLKPIYISFSKKNYILAHIASLCKITKTHERDQLFMKYINFRSMIKYSEIKLHRSRTLVICCNSGCMAPLLVRIAAYMRGRG